MKRVLLIMLAGVSVFVTRTLADAPVTYTKDIAPIVFNNCVGCHLCTIACPFGTVFTLPGTDKATKCNLCGGSPACATACPTGAIEWAEANGAGSWFAAWGEKVAKRYHEAVPV